MKINFILPFYSVRPIGGLKVAYEYANQLTARGHDVTVIHPRFMRNLPTPDRALNRLHRAASEARNWFAPRAGLKWQDLHERVRIRIVREPTAAAVPDGDVVFATAWQTSEYVREYPPEKGAKFYLVMDFAPWIASQDVLERTWRAPLVKITISSWLANNIRTAGVDQEVANIPIGIDFKQFELQTPIVTRKKTILMLYSSSPSKGSEIGLKAIARVKEIHPDLEVLLFGPTMRRRPPGLPAWARYLGNVSNQELSRLYNQSRIYVCSSWAEGFALPPAEAMACGAAVAATDCGGIREFASNGCNALLSVPGDVERLAWNINHLLDDDEERVRLASLGHQSIQSFTWKAATARLEEVINCRVNGSYSATSRAYA